MDSRQDHQGDRSRIAELTTTVLIEGVDAERVQSIADRFESELVKAGNEEAPMTFIAYFVEPQTSPPSLRVGMRFDGLNKKHITSVADDILRNTIRQMRNKRRERYAQYSREGSQLVGA